MAPRHDRPAADLGVLRTPQRDLVPSLARPPLDRVPSTNARPNVLTDFVDRRVQPWGGVPISLAPGVVGALWTLLVSTLVLAGWLLAVRAGATPCSGVLCTALTLDDHPRLALDLAEASAGALGGSVPLTRGLSLAGGPQLGLIVAGVVCGVVALAGALAVLAAAAAFLVLFAFVVDRL